MSARTYPSRPIVAVGVCTLRDAGVLLVRRGRAPCLGQWSLPGGAQELGETAEAAARRELLEETGVEVGELHLAAIVDSVHCDATGAVEYHYTIIDFAARWTAGAARAGSDVSEVAWAAPDALDAFGLSPAACRVVALARTILQL